MKTKLDEFQKTCLVFPFSRTNANAISALLASLDIHPILKELKIIIPNLKDEPIDIVEKIRDFDKIILAFSVFTTQLDEIKNKIEQYRQIFQNKELLVVAGGPHPSGDPFSMLLNGADVVCIGEGEVVFCNIIISFLQAESLETIRGIGYISQSNKFVKTPKAGLIDINDYPPFSVKHKLIRPIEITRGCSWNCRFCQIRSKGVPVRHRSITQIIKYIQYTVDYFSERRSDIRFISPNALSYGSDNGRDVNLEIIEKLLSTIRQTIGEEGKIYFGSFPSEIRPETVTKESAGILSKYTNSTKIAIGGQSGSDKLLEYSDRGHNASETERAVQILVNEGFNVDVDIIFGLPGETKADVEVTIDHIMKLTKIGARIHSHTFMPLVGTPFASESPGVIDKNYLPMIDDLQNKQELSGFHHQQQKKAKIMAERRIKEKIIKQSRNQIDLS